MWVGLYIYIELIFCFVYFIFFWNIFVVFFKFSMWECVLKEFKDVFYGVKIIGFLIEWFFKLKIVFCIGWSLNWV